ncbi:MAG: hypothetical protein ABSG62_10675 [Terracidiphilus sp.]
MVPGLDAETFESTKPVLAALGNPGDQWSDLKGKPEAEFSVKYPDPYYYIPQRRGAESKKAGEAFPLARREKQASPGEQTVGVRSNAAGSNP